MNEKDSKQKQNFKIIIIIGIIFSFLGISIISIPFPNTLVIENLGQFGIVEGVTYSIHYKYPMFSNNQKLIISLGAVNSSFTILVLNDNDFEAWIDEQGGYLPCYEEQNISGVYKTLYHNQPFIGYIHILITAETNLEIYGAIQASYSSHYFILGSIPLMIGISLAIYLVSRNYKYKRHKKN
ncbi:MAG: hypothetical protein HWN80_15585 [Candidatus Lokiarchaeota archaeon]|nr:hypothetical protein [Candidatus Lokiarchaeota archaeon]